MLLILQFLFILNFKNSLAQTGLIDQTAADSVTGVMSECETVPVRDFKNSNRIILLNRCVEGVNGQSFDISTAKVTYYNSDNTPYKGLVREKNGQFIFSDGVDLAAFDKFPGNENKSLDLPSIFTCDGYNGNELQCLICNCFYETRGQSPQEQVDVARVVLSRVLNPNFAKTVCGVVHERKGEESVAQFSWIRLSDDNCLSGQCTPTNLNYKINSSLGEAAEYNNDVDRKGFNSCRQSSLKALQKRNEYFASYYLNKENLEDVPSWVKLCKEKFPQPGNTITKSAETGVSYSHTFYKICEDNERSLIGAKSTSKEPTNKLIRSRRPLPRPKTFMPIVEPAVE